MLLTIALLSVLNAAPADTVAGTWQIKGDVAGNPLDETCVIKQTGTALSGTCQFKDGQPYVLTGEFKEGKITIKHGGDYQGQELTMVYTGALAANEIKGTVDVQPFSVSGDFTAKPAPAGATVAAPAPAKKP